MTHTPHMNPVQWNQALGLARKACAEIFQHGGKPEDALRSFKISHLACDHPHWGHAINMIAYSICASGKTAHSSDSVATAA